MSDAVSRVLRPIVLALLIFSILFAFGLRFDHPRSGLKSAMGSASSSIAVYWHGTGVSKGSKVVVTTGHNGSDPALAFVTNVNGSAIDIQAGKLLARVTPKDVHGKLLAVIPFVGYLFQVVGL